MECCVSGNAKGLTGLMSQYAQDSDTEGADEDIDESEYNIEAGRFNNNCKFGLLTILFSILSIHIVVLW